jgi:hypothetical protein
MSNVDGVHGSEAVNAVIQQLGAELTRLTTDAALRQRALAGDDALLAAALRSACEQVGLTPEDYRRAIAADPSLMQLEKMTIDQAVTGPVDPGPHDAISRESPSGSETNAHYNDTLKRAR